MYTLQGDQRSVSRLAAPSGERPGAGREAGGTRPHTRPEVPQDLREWSPRPQAL